MQLAMLEEQMSGPQAVRYDDVYYPRTDKRAISKLNRHGNVSISEHTNATLIVSFFQLPIQHFL